MKKLKLVKTIAMIMVMVMMLSTSVFAAGNEEDNASRTLTYDFISISGNASDSFSINYQDEDNELHTMTFTMHCTYYGYVSSDYEYAYIERADFPFSVSASIDDVSSSLLIRQIIVENGDNCYADYLLDGTSLSVRIRVTCNQFGDVSLSAHRI